MTRDNEFLYVDSLLQVNNCFRIQIIISEFITNQNFEQSLFIRKVYNYIKFNELII